MAGRQLGRVGQGVASWRMDVVKESPVGGWGRSVWPRVGSGSGRVRVAGWQVGSWVELVRVSPAGGSTVSFPQLSGSPVGGPWRGNLHVRWRSQSPHAGKTGVEAFRRRTQSFRGRWSLNVFWSANLRYALAKASGGGRQMEAPAGRGKPGDIYINIAYMRRRPPRGHPALGVGR